MIVGAGMDQGEGGGDFFNRVGLLYVFFAYYMVHFSPAPNTLSTSTYESLLLHTRAYILNYIAVPSKAAHDLLFVFWAGRFRVACV